jgi:hypothetical protein
LKLLDIPLQRLAYLLDSSFSCRDWQHIFILQDLFGVGMLIEYDQTTLANMTAALDSVCKRISSGQDCPELRKRIADAMIKVAREGRRSFADFLAAGMNVLGEKSAQRGKGGLPGLGRARHIARAIRAKLRS